MGYSLQIFWLQKLQLLVVFGVQLQLGCIFCNYHLQLPIIANLQLRVANIPTIQIVEFAAIICNNCNYQLQFG